MSFSRDEMWVLVKCIYFVVYVLFCCSYSVCASTDWDVLIFTQHWPITVCMQWKEKEEHHSCKILPENSWTIHGIWPTKLGTLGPEFCNNSLHFDLKQLKPIENNLMTYWPDIYNGSESGLWKHEWKKHGTCAAVLEPLNSEIKYFSKGLEWYHMYTMENILARAGISPEYTGYTSPQIWNAVKDSLGKNPDVQCVKDKKNENWYLFEIRICFDKSLELVDCDGVKSNIQKNTNNVLTNCPLSETVLYPGHLPSSDEPHDEVKPYRTSWLLQFLYIIQLLQRITI